MGGGGVIKNANFRRAKNSKVSEGSILIVFLMGGGTTGERGSKESWAFDVYALL